MVHRKWHQLVLDIASLQRVIDLVADEWCQTLTIGNPQRLHELPGGVVGATDVADLARLQKVIESAQRLLERRLPIPLVHLIEVDVIGAEPTQAVLSAADDVMP